MYPSEAKALQPRFLLTCTSCRVVKIGPSDGLGTFGLPNVTQEEDNLTVDDIEFIRDFILKHCKDTF
jgi:hypothetical protein